MPALAMTLTDLQMRAAERGRNTPPPECYRWRAVWWHMEARRSRNPVKCIGYAVNQMRLARAMEADPRHFARKPADRTDWQWSGLSHE